MASIRSVAPAALALALIVTLAACGQDTATTTASPTPSAPPPSQSASDNPATDGPEASPSPEANPSPIDVVELELPVVARVTEDDVQVHTQPSADAPLMTAEDLSGTGDTPDVILGSGSQVLVTLGPLVSEGESWYEVAAADGSELYFAFGWIPARVLEPEDAPEGLAPIHAVHGQGEGAEVSTEIMSGSPVTVRFAATTMPDADSCDIEVTLVRSDGTRVNVATDEVTGPMVFELTPERLSSLFQEQAGTVTLEVDSDCSFAATMIAP